jgi:hypothetical protein
MKDAHAQMPKWEPSSQQDFIVSALAEQLKNSHQLEKEKLKMQQQPSIGQPIVAQQTPQTVQQPTSMLPQGIGGGGYSVGGGNEIFPMMNTQPTQKGYFDMGIPKSSPRQQQNQFSF